MPIVKLVVTAASVICVVVAVKRKNKAEKAKAEKLIKVRSLVKEVLHDNVIHVTFRKAC